MINQMQWRRRKGTTFFFNIDETFCAIKEHFITGVGGGEEGGGFCLRE